MSHPHRRDGMRVPASTCGPSAPSRSKCTRRSHAAALRDTRPVGRATRDVKREAPECSSRASVRRRSRFVGLKSCPTSVIQPSTRSSPCNPRRGARWRSSTSAAGAANGASSTSQPHMPTAPRIPRCALPRRRDRVGDPCPLRRGGDAVGDLFETRERRRQFVVRRRGVVCTGTAHSKIERAGARSSGIAERNQAITVNAGAR